MNSFECCVTLYFLTKEYRHASVRGLCFELCYFMCSFPQSPAHKNPTKLMSIIPVVINGPKNKLISLVSDKHGQQKKRSIDMLLRERIKVNWPSTWLAYESCKHIGRSKKMLLHRCIYISRTQERTLSCGPISDP